MTLHTPNHNLLHADQEHVAAQKAARLHKTKLALAFSAACLSILFAALQLPRLAPSSFARTDSSVTLHRPPPVALTGSNGEVVGIPHRAGSKETPEVLGVSTTKPPAKQYPTTTPDIKALIARNFAALLAQGQLIGPQGPQGPQGAAGVSSGPTPGFSGPSGLVQNDNGKTTAVIGGNPIVSYYPPVQSSGFSGTSLAGFGSLSSNSLTVSNAITAGTGAFSGQLSSGPLNVSGSAAISGTLSAGTSTLSSLTVSGPATFTGSTTITSLTVTGTCTGCGASGSATTTINGLLGPSFTFNTSASSSGFSIATSSPGIVTFYTPTNLLMTSRTINTAGPLQGGGPLSSDLNLSITQASSTASGFLSSADWNLFNNKLSSALTSFAGLTGPSLSIATTSDTNLGLQITAAGNTVTFTPTWTGTLAAGRLNSNVVQAITNDTNLTGSITNQTLTLGWTGQLAVTRGGTGANTLTQYALLAGNATGAIATINPGTMFQVLRSGGSTAYPIYSDLGSLLTAGSNIAITGTSTIAVASSPSFTGTTTAANLIVSGNVGIGTTTPGYKLTVSGVTQSTGGFTTDGTLTAVLGGNNLTRLNAIPYVSASGTLSQSDIDIGGTNALGNVFVGQRAGNSTMTGAGNTVLGYQALQNTTSGSPNVAVGLEALKNNTTGQENVAINYYALHNSVGGSQQVAIGDHAMEATLNTNYNNCVGSYCFTQNTGSSFNNGMGLGFGQNHLSGGGGLTGIGHHALLQDQTGQDNLAFGHAAGYQNINGSQNIFAGAYSGFVAPGDNSIATNGITLTLSNGSANLGVGDYCYKVAYEFDNVESGVNSSAGGNCITTNSSHKEVTITGLPTYSGPLNVTARIIVRTLVNADNAGSAILTQPYYRVTRIANNSTTTFVDNVADGSLGIIHSDPNGCILLGSGTDLWGDNLQNSATCWKSGQIVIGTGAASSTEMYLGTGPYNASPVNFHLQPSGAMGTNVVGAALYLGGGWSTGNGTGGPVVIEISGAGSSGTARNTKSEVARFTSTGLGIGTASPTSTLFVQGSGSTNPFVVASSTGTQLLTVNSAGLLQIGGTTSSSPALKRNATELDVRLADDSGFTGLLAGGSSGINATSSTVSLNVQGSGTLDPLNVASSTGTSLLTVKANGNVGIGTTTPGQLLSVAGSALFTGPVISGVHKPATDSTTAIQFQTAGGTSILNIDTTNSRVGIGTTPTHVFHVTSATDSMTGYFFNSASGGRALEGDGTGAGISYGLYGTMSGTASSNGTAVVALNTQGTAGAAYGIQSTSSGNNTLDYGVVATGGGAGSTNNYGMYGQANGSTSGTNIAGYFTAVNGTNNYALITGTGNVGIGTSTPTLGPLTMASGAYVTSGGVWTNASDRNLKENFATMSPASILQNIDQLPITEWNYKNEDPSIKHIGPVAQDFYSIFHVGNSDKSISTIDPSGIALLGIQALDQKIGALQGSLTVNATATALSVYIPSNFSGDSVGEAQIQPGASSVRVSFSQRYQYQPIITFSPVGAAAGAAITRGAYITNVDATGFTIELATPTPGFVTSESVTFDWHSFASPAEQLTVSDGTTQPIQLIVATTAQVSAPLTVSPAPAAPTTASSSPAVATSTPDNLAQASQASSTPEVLGTSTPASSLQGNANASTSTPSSDSSAVSSASSTAVAADPAINSPAPTMPAPAEVQAATPTP